MLARADSRRGGAIAWILVALVVLGLSVLTLSWTSGRRREASAAQPKRFAGAQTAHKVSTNLRFSPITEKVTVGIVREAASASYFDKPARFDSGLTRWSEAIREVGAEVAVLSPAQLETERPEVILIPGSPCVGPVTRAAIDTALAEGRGVILTWLSGIADGNCTPVGYGMITQLTGALRLDTLEVRRDAYLTVPRGGPLATDVPPGSRLEVTVANHVALRVPGRDAYWSDYLENPQPAHNEELLDAAVAHVQHGRGRVVYWGFDLPLVINDGPDGWNTTLATMLVRNSVAWAASLPLASVEPWPRSRWSAAVLAQDVEDEFGNGRFALDSLRAAGVRGTFFVVSNLAKQNKDLVKEMAKYGEVGTHSENHKLLGGAPDTTQARRLALTQKELTKLLGKPITGLRPPEEQFDVATLSAWVAAGGTYVFGANDARTASPEVVTSGKDTLVLFGRNSNDDFISVRKLGRNDPNALAREYITAHSKVKELGGLYLLSYHSQMLSRSDLVPAVAKVARAIAADSTVWLTTAGDVAKWWRTRYALRVSAKMVGSNRMELTVTNPTREPISGVVATIAPVDGSVATSTTVGWLLPSHDARIRVELPPLVPGKTVVASIGLGQKLAGDSNAP